MKLSSMRYKDFEWPHNPQVYSIDFERKVVAHKIPFGYYYLQDLGRTRRVMKGEGEFVGEDAYLQFCTLATLFYERTPGVLIHPLWQAAEVYFVGLRLEQEPRPDYVRYSFEFWETEGLRPGGTIGSVTADGTVTQEEVVHTVLSGETLWGIAQAYDTTVEALMALNPWMSNPNLIVAGDEVRVQ